MGNDSESHYPQGPLPGGLRIRGLTPLVSIHSQNRSEEMKEVALRGKLGVKSTQGCLSFTPAEIQKDS